VAINDVIHLSYKHGKHIFKRFKVMANLCLRWRKQQWCFCAKPTWR